MLRSAVLVGMLAVASRAAAEPPRVALHYTPVDGCPDERAIRDGVAAQLGRDPFGDDAHAEIAAVIERTESELHATITVPGYRERELHSGLDHCGELATAIELAIAIAIDELSAKPSGPAEAPVGAIAAAPVAPSARTETTTTTLAGRVAILAALGTTPGAAFGVGIGVAARRGAFSLALEGRADLHGDRAAIAGGSIDGELVAASLVPCVHRGGFAGCVVATAGALHATAHDITDAHDAMSPYVAFGGRLAWTVDTRLAALVLQLDLALPVTRTELRVGMDSVWMTSQVAGTAAIALQRTFL